MKKLISILLTIVMVISLFGCTYNANTETHGHDHETTAPVDTGINTEPTETVGEGTVATDPVETTVPNETEGAEPVGTTVPDETEGNAEGTEPHEHAYTHVITAPTCVEKGYTTYTCECGDEYVADEVEAKGHEYTSEIISPTCEEWGYTVYTCSCGDSYKSDYTDPHPNRKVIDYGEDEGLQGHYYYIMFECPDCGDIYMVDFGDDLERRNEELLEYGITVDSAEHEHKYDKKVTKPTCESKGYTTYTCSCGDSYKSDYTDATGHDYKTTTVEPTTESKGYDLHECKNCGKSYKDNYTDKLPADNGDSGSDDNDGEIPEYNDENNCDYNGSNHSYAYDDGRADWSKAVYYEPTCTEWGRYELTCTKCGYVGVHNEERPLGHDYVWVFQDDGHDTGTCNRCGHVENINPDMANIPWEALDRINAKRAEAGLPAMEYASEWQELANMRAVEYAVTGSKNRPNSQSFVTLCKSKGYNGTSGVDYGLGYALHRVSNSILNAEYTKVTFAEYKGYYVIMVSK